MMIDTFAERQSPFQYNHTVRLKKIKIRSLRQHESYHSGHAGEYKRRGKLVHYLTNAHAETLYALRDCRTAEDQFEFFAYAFLRDHVESSVLIRNENIFNTFSQLAKKHGGWWHGNVRSVLPQVGWDLDNKILNENGFDIEMLKLKFNKFASYEFILYDPIDTRPTGIPSTYDPAWEFEVGNYDVYPADSHPYGPVIALPSHTLTEYRRRFLAVLAAEKLRLSSIDYALKQYTGHTEFDYQSDIHKEKLIGVLRELIQYLENYVRKDHRHSGGEDRVGIVAASAALSRSYASFRSIFCLMGRGYFVEALVLCRHIIEQCAWAYAVKDMKEISLIEKIKPSKVISAHFHPNTKRLNGELSKYVHLSAEKRHEYLEMPENDLLVIHKSHKHLLKYVPYIILTLDIYVSTMESICLDHYENVTSWKKSRAGGWQLDPHRHLVKTLKKYRV